MNIKEVMCDHPEYIAPTTTLQKAAKIMQELNTGFLPIGDDQKDKLIGTITDRDIVTRGLANDKDIHTTTVKDIMTEDVFYCFENDPVENAIDSMKQLQVRRLVVLDQNKKLVGIVSLGDIATHTHNKELAGEAIEKVSEQRRVA